MGETSWVVLKRSEKNKHTAYSAWGKQPPGLSPGGCFLISDGKSHVTKQ